MDAKKDPGSAPISERFISVMLLFAMAMLMGLFLGSSWTTMEIVSKVDPDLVLDLTVGPMHTCSETGGDKRCRNGDEMEVFDVASSISHEAISTFRADVGDVFSNDFSYHANVVSGLQLASIILVILCASVDTVARRVSALAVTSILILAACLVWVRITWGVSTHYSNFISVHNLALSYGLYLNVCSALIVISAFFIIVHEHGAAIRASFNEWKVFERA